MTEREWYIINPDPVGPVQYPNEESADKAAQEAAQGGTDCVTVIRCTATDLRRYTRQVTVTAEDVSLRK